MAKQGLHVGHDSFADSFGYLVYCKARNETAECPGCGKWNYIGRFPSISVSCRECGLNVEFSRAGENWWTVSTEALCQSKKETFFLPRLWNEKRPWISLGDLEAKFNEFIKEKQNV